MTKKILLTDCDGCLVDWEWGFDRFMLAQGYSMRPNGHEQYLIHRRYTCDAQTGRRMIRQFNESADIADLPPLRDAVHWVTRLHQQGWQFVCITSLSDLARARQHRQHNLDTVFGHGVIQQLICLPVGADKDQALEPYRGSGLAWLEDKPANADLGQRLGLRSMLMNHQHNQYHQCHYPRVDNWAEVYDIVTSL